jgi:hypothetical protein
MSTRAQVRFATREKGQSFSEHPNAIHAQFYVHSDGYPYCLGMDIARSFEEYGKDLIGWEIESLDARHGDLEYIYYIWQAPGRPTYISIFEVGYDESKCNTCGQKVSREDKCIFVGSPLELINELEENK